MGELLIDYLLDEDGDYLLQEDGDKLELEQSSDVITARHMRPEIILIRDKV